MREYWYDTIKASSHEELTKGINEAAGQGWEPIQCWSDRKAAAPYADINMTDHFCLMRQPVSLAARTK